MASRKTSKTTAVVPWEQEFADLAVAQAQTEKPTSGNYSSISLRGGILSVDDDPVEGNEINVVILDAIHENQYYTADFDPDSPATPSCYAFGRGEEDEVMAPHEQSVEKQADACEGCWANEWNSADKGKGKACKEVRRMLVVSQDALESADELRDAEVRSIKIPVMSVKNWTNYVRNVLAEQIKRPSWGVVTTIKLVPDAKSQFRAQFIFAELVEFDQELYDVMKTKVEEAKNNIAIPYPVYAEEEAPPPKQRGRGAPAGRGKAAQAAPAARTSKPAAKPAAGASKPARGKY